MPAPKSLRAIDRLRQAANLEPVKKTVELTDGSTFEMFVTPLTMAERERAQKNAKSEEATAFALQLLIAKAQDENSNRLFAPGEIDVLKHEVKDKDLQALMVAVLTDEESEQLDPKILSAQLRKDSWLMLKFGVAKELGMSVSQVSATMTPEELIGWSAYFHILNEDQEKAMEKAKRRR